MPGLYKFKLDRTNRRLTPRTYNLSPNFFCLELMIYCHLATWTSTFFVCETFLFACRISRPCVPSGLRLLT